jgi:uncharacterized protein YndB with AHSA1/START domain
MSTDTKTRNVVVNRVIDAPVDQVWKAWSDSNYVRQWWGPIGFTCPVAEMDFREGGTSLLCMRAPKELGGLDMYNTWTYSQIVPMERIEFIQKFADQNGSQVDPAEIGIPPGVPYEVRHVITFKALNNAQTVLTVTEFGYVSDQAHDISKAGMEQCIDKLSAIFAKSRQ